MQNKQAASPTPAACGDPVYVLHQVHAAVDAASLMLGSAAEGVANTLCEPTLQVMVHAEVPSAW
jgi:hypothetical protein